MNRWNKLISSPRLLSSLGLALLLVLICPILFQNLTETPIRLWDESRLATNAMEMLANKNWIVTHFNGNPDLWNTKPPLMIWFQVMGMKILGPGELAARLPAAIAALLTCALLVALGRYFLRNTLYGAIAAIVLVTTPGYIDSHAARAGEYDSLLTLLTTLYCLSFFLFLESRKISMLYVFFGALALAILTKGPGAVVFLPALGLYALFRRQIKSLLCLRHFYIGSAIVIALVAGYYGWRELLGPGYLQAVYNNELGGRYLQSIEGHSKPRFYYLTKLFETRMQYWLPMVLMGTATGMMDSKSPLGRLTRFLAFLCLTYLIILTRMETKLPWYDVPMFPFLSLIAATFIVLIVNAIAKRDWQGGSAGKWGLVCLFLAIVLFPPYSARLERTRNPEDQKGQYLLSYCLQDAVRGKIEIGDLTVPIDGYAPHYNFYLEILRQDGVDVPRKSWSQLVPGETVLATDDDRKKMMEPLYAYQLIRDVGQAKIYEILERR
jgi:4-amino-4-deoxy-L-arabinose transferase-like glycosyltransferase